MRDNSNYCYCLPVGRCYLPVLAFDTLIGDDKHLDSDQGIGNLSSVNLYFLCPMEQNGKYPLHGIQLPLI